MLSQEQLQDQLHGLADRAVVSTDLVAGTHQRIAAQRRSAVTVAAVALIVVALAGAGVYLPHTRNHAPAAPPAAGVALGDPAQVWPGAVVHLPAALPDGRAYDVINSLGGGRYLVALVPYPWTYALFTPASGQVTVLGDSLARPGDNYLQGQNISRYVQSPNVSPDGIAWIVQGTRDNHAVMDIWAVPTGAGYATRVTTLPDVSTVFAFDPWVVGDSVIYGTGSIQSNSARVTPIAMYSVPVAGGTPRLIPGSQQRFPLYEGWTTAFSTTVMGTLVPADQLGPTNVVTGQHVAVLPHRAMRREDSGYRMLCLPAWCIGGTTGGIAAQRPDGTRFAAGPKAPAGEPVDEPVVTAVVYGEGRFVIGRTVVAGHVAYYIWDVATGKTASLASLVFQGTPNVAPGQWSIELPDVSSKLHTVLDLTAIH